MYRLKNCIKIKIFPIGHQRRRTKEKQQNSRDSEYRASR